MVQLLDTRPELAAEPLPDIRPEPEAVCQQPTRRDRSPRVLVYGDFTCPRSYLAARRSALLASAGVDVEWRAVERHPRRPGRGDDDLARLRRLREEAERVLALLLPGEELPYTLAGFVPDTRPAVSGYAEAFAAGVGPRVRQLLFEAFWMHGFDLGTPEAVRLLLVDDIRSGTSTSELLHEWGYAVDATGGPLTTTAWRLLRHWTAGWRDVGEQRLPAVVVDGGPPLCGDEAVARLGHELLRLGVPVDEPPARPALPVQPRRDLAPYSWVSENGNRYLRDYQRAHRTRPLPGIG